MSKYLALDGIGTCYKQQFVCVEIPNKIFVIKQRMKQN